MSLPAQCQVRFNIPMDTDDESQYNGESGSPTSNAAMGNTAFYFGIGAPLPLRFNFAMDIPMLVVESTSPIMQQPLNLGFKLPIPAFNLGFQLPIPINQPQVAAHSAPAFDLGFNAPIPAIQTAVVESAAMVPAVQTAVRVSDQILAQEIERKRMRGTKSLPDQTEKCVPGAKKNVRAFNLGFQLPIPINQPQVAAHSAPAFNLGFNAPIPVTQTAAVESAAMVPAVQTPVRHVGYTTNNKHKLDSHVLFNSDPPAAFRFNSCKDAATTNIGIISWQCRASSINILAQMMVGGSLGVSEDIRDPKPDKVLDSNRLMLLVFCENRDRLTRIFRDLISLHHMAQVQEWVTPVVNALLDEVEQAEALISDSE
ncbi:hypothetical protein EDB19DRAFT_1831892 [Suillus lakei]|nr:hypothetical protein EDB19DRAFT_1831892 [Suillus lakei]